MNFIIGVFLQNNEMVVCDIPINKENIKEISEISHQLENYHQIEAVKLPITDGSMIMIPKSEIRYLKLYDRKAVIAAIMELDT